MAGKTMRELRTGIPEIQLKYFESNTKLANNLVLHLKKDFKHNILYIFIGFVFSLIPTTIIQINNSKETQELNKLIFDKNVYENQNYIEFQQMRSKIIYLEKKLDSLIIE